MLAGVQPEWDELSQKLFGLRNVLVNGRSSMGRWATYDRTIWPGLLLPWNESVYETWPEVERRRLFDGAPCSWNLLSSTPKKLLGELAGAEVAGVAIAGTSWLGDEICRCCCDAGW